MELYRHAIEEHSLKMGPFDVRVNGDRRQDLRVFFIT